MNVRNYRSKANSRNSIDKIERILIEIGARNIAKEYDATGRVDSIMFSIPHPGAQGMLPFRLPAKREAIAKAIMKSTVRGRRPTENQIMEANNQAERTAWKNILEWVHLQATMIKLEQIEFMEAFMPYTWSIQQGKTYFELVKDSGFKQLN